ncbi:PLAC8 family-domain-containing protein [Penicillium canescens]|nr:PLAC8 family-domain-containing protein [Penicillium canescens]KAJ6029129.1 PLAC8 family-domain-containing protein [Penicillium canescens]
MFHPRISLFDELLSSLLDLWKDSGPSQKSDPFQFQLLQLGCMYSLRCGLFTCLGFVWSHWILQTIRRSELRQQFGIKGNCCGDCCAVFWCSCCAIIQEEKEAELRTRPAAQAAYQPTSGMVYPQ